VDSSSTVIRVIAKGQTNIPDGVTRNFRMKEIVLFKTAHEGFPMKQMLFTFTGIVLLLGACAPSQPEADPRQFEYQLETMVATTLTAYPTVIPTLTDTPLPTATETLQPTPVAASPTAIPLEQFVIPTAKPEYACNTTRRDPADDTQIRRDSEFDIEWTLINTGTQQWEKETYLVYQSGPEMTDTKKLLLPRLEPGETYDVALRATAPSEKELQIMVWAVVGPGKNTQYWMCYPYIRIIVKK
jgi:hypothetical protein